MSSGRVQSAQARAEVEAAGVTVNEIADKAPFQEAMTVVYDEYLAANPDLKIARGTRADDRVTTGR